MPVADLEDELDAAGRRLAAADAEREAAIGQVREVARRAHAADVPVAQISRRVGLSRLSVYRLLDRSA